MTPNENSPRETAVHRLQQAATDLLAAVAEELETARRQQVLLDIVKAHSDDPGLGEMIAAAQQRQRAETGAGAPTKTQLWEIANAAKEQVDAAWRAALQDRYPHYRHTHAPPSHAAPPPPRRGRTAQPAEPDVWYPIAECRPRKGDPPPGAIRIDGVEMPTCGKNGRRAWKHVVCQTARWLLAQELLTPERLPVRIGSESRPSLSADSDGMNAPENIAAGVFMETQYNCVKTVARAVALLRRYRVDVARCQILAQPSLRRTDTAPRLTPPRPATCATEASQPLCPKST